MADEIRRPKRVNKPGRVVPANDPNTVPKHTPFTQSLARKNSKSATEALREESAHARELSPAGARRPRNRSRAVDSYNTSVLFANGREMNAAVRAVDFKDARRKARKDAEAAFPTLAIASVAANRRAATEPSDRVRTTGSRSPSTKAMPAVSGTSAKPSPNQKVDKAVTRSARTPNSLPTNIRQLQPKPKAASYKCRECLREKPITAFPSGNRWRCLDCGGQERGRSVRTVSGGLPGSKR